MTPYGQAGTQYPQPLQTSGCTTTVPNSVRNRAPVGQTSRQAAWVQCLQTSDIISQRKSVRPSALPVRPGGCEAGIPRNSGPAAIRAAACGSPDGRPGWVPVSGSLPAATAAVSSLTAGPQGVPANGVLRWPAGKGCSMNATCRHEFAVNAPVLSYDMPSRSKPEAGTSFHSLHATSH